MKSKLPVKKSRSSRRKPPVKKSRSARRKPPVKKSRSARRKPPVKKSRSARRKSTRRKPPVKKSRSARRKPPVKKSRSTRRKPPVKKSRSSRRKLPLKKSRSARRKLPVKKSRSERRKLLVKKSRSARRKNQKIMLKGGGDEAEEVGKGEEEVVKEVGKGEEEVVKEVGKEEEKCTINLILNNLSYDKILIISELSDKFIYKNSIVQKYEKDNIALLNDKAHSLYISAKKEKIYNNMFYEPNLFSDFYDAIGSLYICTQKIQDVWNQIASNFNFNIAIFNGSNSVLKDIKKESDYIVGLNILMSCRSKNKALELNKLYNRNGKYFIGIDGYTHNYGSSFYICLYFIEISKKDFVTEYEKYPDEFPIIRIIKIFFNKYKFNNDTTEQCSVLTIKDIINKLIKLEPKITNKKSFNTKEDNYFNSEFHHKCYTEEICTIDVEFENYIREIMKTIEKKYINLFSLKKSTPVLATPSMWPVPARL
jgi:hypothetical protein